MENKTRYHLNHYHLDDPLRFDGVELLQIGRRYCEPTDVIAAHPHLNWYELTVVTGGKGTVLTNGESAQVQSGDIYLSFPCDVHEIRADRQSRLEYDFFSFYCENEPWKSELKSVTQRQRGADSRIFQDEKISLLVKDAITEFSVKNQPFAENVLSNLFQLLLSYLIRDFNNVKQNSANVSGAEILCFQLMNYVDTHVYSIERLSEIAEKFNYNYGYLSSVFKQTTGKTLNEYFHHRKMETAKALVLEKKKKIGEIAEMLHYSLYSFSKAFKEKYGVSPKTLQSNA